MISQRLGLVPIAIFVLFCQGRFAAETIRARSTFLYIPFRIEPFTNRVGSTYRSADGLYAGAEILAINGRPFSGASVYAQELRRAHDYLEAANRLPPSEMVEAFLKWPFVITLLSDHGVIRTQEIYFANCTCGSLTIPEVYWWIVTPQLFCTFLGLLAVMIRPSRVSSWIFLGLMLSMAQMKTVPGQLGDWSQEADPMQWRDGFRIPFLVYQSFFVASWPAWLLLFAAYCYRLAMSRRAWMLIASPLFAYAAFGTAESVTWSENIEAGVMLHRFLETYSAELLVGSFLCAVVLAAHFGKRWLLAAVAILLISTAFVWSLPLSPDWTSYARLTLGAMENLRTRDLIGAGFAAAMLLLGTGANWSVARSAVLLSLLALALPFLCSVGGGSLLWWTPSVLKSTLALFGLGGAGLTWHLIRSRFDEAALKPG